MKVENNENMSPEAGALCKTSNTKSCDRTGRVIKTK